MLLAGGAGPAGAGRAAAQEPQAGQAPASPERFGFGRAATEAEIAAWDIDVRPDGAGLPAGEGTAASGAPIYARECASCHGAAGEGGVADPLVGYEPESTPPFGPRYEAWRGDGEDVRFTVGNYWPYATTLYDYILRAMPSDAPGTLQAGRGLRPGGLDSRRERHHRPRRGAGRRDAARGRDAGPRHLRPTRALTRFGGDAKARTARLGGSGAGQWGPRKRTPGAWGAAPS